jgi:hypothetical protein
MGEVETPGLMEARELVLWRESGGQRQGLACVVTCCLNPDCDCQEAHLQAFEVDDRFEAIRTNGDKVEVLHRAAPGEAPPPSRHVAALVDLETGQVREGEGGAVQARQPELIGWLREMVDDAALETLRDYRRRIKDQARIEAEEASRTAWREQDWTGWDGEEPVGWVGATAGSRDVYELDGERFDAEDMYCIRAGCDCQDVRVRFIHRVQGGGTTVGTVFVDGPTAEVVGTSHPPGERVRLGRLWEAFAARRDVTALSRRWRQMKGLAPQIRALRREQFRPKPIRSERRVGRNDPCPCGSGKKYKRCCLPRERA